MPSVVCSIVLLGYLFAGRASSMTSPPLPPGPSLQAVSIDGGEPVIGRIARGGPDGPRFVVVRGVATELWRPIPEGAVVTVTPAPAANPPARPRPDANATDAELAHRLLFSQP